MLHFGTKSFTVTLVALVLSIAAGTTRAEAQTVHDSDDTNINLTTANGCSR
jgi:hypothetical protein